jgi:hypothetical protein
MLNIIFSKAAFAFYLFVILTELATRYGIKQTTNNGYSKVLPLADLCGLAAISFMVYYSYQTNWYAFILLLLCYVTIYMMLNFIISIFIVNKKALYNFSSKAGYLLIPVAALMFLLVNK